MLMKKFCLIAVALLLTQAGYAQSLKQGKLENVTRLTKDAVKYENPRWSPDGKSIAFTELGYDGLYVMNADGSSKKQLSNESGVGYLFQWSADCNEILIRDTRWEEGADGIRRYHAAWALDLTGKKIRMTEDAEYMQPAAWRYSPTGAKSVVAPDTKVIPANLNALPKSIAEQMRLNPTSNISFITDSENLYIVNSRGIKTLINEGASFCPSLSPDGKMVAFNQMDDVCVMNVDGTGKRILGRGFNPSWVNNNQIIFELTTDDGHNYTSGELYMINIDGSNHRILTSTPNLIEMNPCVSPDGTKVVFCSYIDGQIYVADIK